MNEHVLHVVNVLSHEHNHKPLRISFANNKKMPWTSETGSDVYDKYRGITPCRAAPTTLAM